MANPVAPKITAPLKGTLSPSYSNISYGLTSDVEYGFYPNFSEAYGSTNWRNGIEVGGTANGSENSVVYYAIYSDRTTQGLAGTNLAVAWGITQNTGVASAILNTVNRLPGMGGATPHLTFEDAMAWLKDGGYFVSNLSNYPQIEFDNPDLRFAFDPTFIASYPWYGTEMYDLVGNSSNPANLISTCSPQVDTNSGATPYILTEQISGNGFIQIPSDVPSQLTGLNTIVFSLWFKMTDLSSKQTLLHVPRSGGSVDPWLSLSWDNTTNKLFIVADPRSSGTQYTKEIATISTDVFYLATISLDLLNDDIYISLSDTSTFGSLFNQNNNSTWGGSGQSSIDPVYMAIGAKISETGDYNSEGARNTYFGSLHIHTSDSSTYNFNSNMAEKIWDETKAYY